MRKRSRKLKKTKKQHIIQDVTVNVAPNRRRRNSTILERIPKLYQTHQNMRPDPDTNIALLQSRIDSLTSSMINLNLKTHQEAVDMIRRIKVSSNAIQASMDPQSRFAVPGPGQAPAEGSVPIIDLTSPRVELSGVGTFEAPSEVQSMRQPNFNEGLDQAGPSQQPTKRGLDSSSSMDERFMTRKQKGGKKAEQTVKQKGVKEYKERVMSQLTSSGVLAYQYLPNTPGLMGTPNTVASSSSGGT